MLGGGGVRYIVQYQYPGPTFGPPQKVSPSSEFLGLGKPGCCLYLQWDLSAPIEIRALVPGAVRAPGGRSPSSSVTLWGSTQTSKGLWHRLPCNPGRFCSGSSSRHTAQ